MTTSSLWWKSVLNMGLVFGEGLNMGGDDDPFRSGGTLGGI